MKSPELSQRLREAAIQNGLGGNRYGNRRPFLDSEIEKLFLMWKENFKNNMKYKSLFSNRILLSENKWINDLSRNMITDSSRKFLYLLEVFTNGEKQCVFCNKILDQRSFAGYTAKFKRYCPVCVENSVWKTKAGSSAETRRIKGEKISRAKKEFYQTEQGRQVSKSIGIKNSKNVTEYNKTEAGLLRIENSREPARLRLNRMINDGTFTPAVNARWTHWTAEVKIADKIKKFRSSWEACFYVSNPTLQYESLRIPYANSKTNKSRLYIADFFDKITNTVYEIKPIDVWTKEQDKMQPVIDFCRENNINFVWVNEKNINTFVRESDFNDFNMPQYVKLQENLRKCKHLK